MTHNPHTPPKDQQEDERLKRLVVAISSDDNARFYPNGYVRKIKDVIAQTTPTNDSDEQLSVKEILEMVAYAGYLEGIGNKPVGNSDKAVTAQTEAIESLIAQARKGYRHDEVTDEKPRWAKYPDIRGIDCPACKRSTLFLAEGNYITCGNLECKQPDFTEATQANIAQAIAEAQLNVLQELLGQNTKGTSINWDGLGRAVASKRMELLRNSVAPPQIDKEEA